MSGLSWKITLWKGIKFAAITLIVSILSAITPDVLRTALGHLPFADIWSMAVVPVISGLIVSATNAVKHWND
jgi:hypothetical protein